MTVIKEYYEGGQLKYEQPYREGKLNGVSRGWWVSGRLAYKTSFLDGVFHGPREWWKDGKLKSTRYYLYGSQVTEEEYRRHELIEKLSGL